jgi:hypothetical protein
VMVLDGTHYTALYCILLYCILLYCAVLYAVLYAAAVNVMRFNGDLLVLGPITASPKRYLIVRIIYSVSEYYLGTRWVSILQMMQSV